MPATQKPTATAGHSLAYRDEKIRAAMPIRDYEIDGILFSWDERKYAVNLKKHKLKFEEAAAP